MTSVLNNHDAHFFENLYRNTFEGKAIDSCYLIHHKSRGFQLESKSVHWFWRLWNWLTTTSYDLKKHAVTLIDRLDALNTTDSKELAAAAKVSKIMADIIKHPLRTGRNWRTWDELQNRFADKTGSFLEHLAKENAADAASFACKVGEYKRALKFLNDTTIPDDLIKEYGKKLFYKAQEIGDEKFCLQYIAERGEEVDDWDVRRYVAGVVGSQKVELLEKLIRQGAGRYIDEHTMQRITISVMNQKKSSCALSFLKTISDRKAKLSNDSTFLHVACRNQLVDVVKYLIENDDNINAKDREGDTPLHVACSLLDAEITMLLLAKGADCSAKNNKEKSPLTNASSLYRESADFEDFIQILFVDFPVVQNVLQTNGVGKLLDTLDTRADELVASSGVNKAFELALWFQDDQLAKNIVQHLTAEQFFTAVDELARSYPPHALEVVEMAPFSVNKEHYKEGVIAAIPKPKEDISLQEYIRLFQTLNLTNSRRDDFDDFLDVSALPIPANVRGSAQLKASLRTMLSRIENEIAFLGTPHEGSPALPVFYATIRKSLQHVLLELRKEHGKPEYVKMLHTVFKDLFSCMNQCGGRWYETSVNLYLTICMKRPSTFDQTLFTSLSEYRDVILHTIIDEKRHQNSVHDYNVAVKKLGVELGLPAAEERAQFEDKYIGAGVDLDDVRKKFGERYTPQAILHEWIMPRLGPKEQGAFKDQFLQYAKSLASRDWDKKRYDALYAVIAEMRKERKSDREIKDALMGHDIYVNAGQTFEEAIETDRKDLYLQKVVHDETTGAIKHSFLLKALVQFRILQSTFAS